MELELEYIPKILELLKILELDDSYSLQIYSDFSVAIVDGFDKEITLSYTLRDTYFELLEKVQQVEKNMSNNIVMVNEFGEYVVIKQELVYTVYPSDRDGNVLDEDLEQYLDNYELCVELLN